MSASSNIFFSALAATFVRAPLARLIGAIGDRIGRTIHAGPVKRLLLRRWRW